MVSFDQDKVNGLKSRKDAPGALAAAAGRMARALRGLPGVRHVEAVVFRDWRERGEGKQRPVFAPVGAVVIVEAAGPKRLQGHIDAIWRAAGAKGLDQRGLEMSAVDNW